MSARIVTATDGMAEAAERLRNGGIVAVPTETVYGLAANALDADAVAQIYRIKGRPATNPLIVHVADAAAARKLASEWPDSAAKLAARFWPGPLTLVVPKAANLPDSVTAGGPTVGLRVPNHPVALELLRLSGVALAAPSANRSEEVSPTCARHVADSLGAYADDLLILDGGSCDVGIESTVVDVTGDALRILRPGMITAQMIQEAAGAIIFPDGADSAIARSPGQAARHYAPSVPVILINQKQWWEGCQSGDAFVFCGDVLPRVTEAAAPLFKWLPAQPAGYAHLLYTSLRELDRKGVTRICICRPPETPEWAAIHDRLRRAAAKKTEDNP